MFIKLSRKLGLFAAAALFALLSALPASAVTQALKLRLTDTDTNASITIDDFVFSQSPGASKFSIGFSAAADPACPSCGWIGHTNWKSLVVSGEFRPAPLEAFPGRTHRLGLIVAAESLAAAKLKAEISFVGLTRTIPWETSIGFLFATGKVWGPGDYTVESFWDRGNAPFATTNSIAGPVSGGRGDSAGFVWDTEIWSEPTISMTTVLNLRHDGRFKSPLLTTQTALFPVPLPAAGWMLVAGLAGLGALARRRRAA